MYQKKKPLSIYEFLLSALWENEDLTYSGLVICLIITVDVLRRF